MSTRSSKIGYAVAVSAASTLIIGSVVAVGAWATNLHPEAHGEHIVTLSAGAPESYDKGDAIAAAQADKAARDAQAAAALAAQQAADAAAAQAAADAQAVADAAAAQAEADAPDASSDAPEAAAPVDSGIPAGAWPLTWRADPNATDGGSWDFGACTTSASTINGQPYCIP